MKPESATGRLRPRAYTLAVPIALLLGCGPLPTEPSCSIDLPGPARSDLPALTQRAQSWVAPREAPSVVAHRGFACCFPENTLEAITGAFHLGAPSVEVDVRVTSDGVPVLLHDETVDRTTDGTGHISSLTLADLSRLDACSWFPGSSGPCAVPTLRAALSAHTTGFFFLEVKAPVTPCQMSSVLRDVFHASATHRVAILTSDLGILQLSLERASHIPAAHVSRRPVPLQILTEHGVTALFLPIDTLFANAEYAATVVTSEVILGTWTAHSERQFARASELGARWILADRALSLPPP